MKISEEKKREILEKKEILNDAKINLKKEFVGIDDVIDELLDDIQSWYLFPEGQIRPTIINIWGLTGVGKTSLVQAMFKHINMDDIIYKFNVGDYAGQGDGSLSYVFSRDLKDKEHKPVAVMFDEFQLGRTIDESGNEVQKSGLRVIWDLLDSGKLEYIDNNWSGGEVMKYVYRLEKCINEGVEIENGVVVNGLNKFKDIFDLDDIVEEDGKDEVQETPSLDANKKTVKKSNIPENFAIPSKYIYSMKNCFDDEYYSENLIHDAIKNLDAHQIVELLELKLKIVFKPRLYDYTKSCIFIIGNLDEAYHMTKQVSPDNNPDDFHKHSLSIGLTEIKASLKTRFRVEQIGRLGNNHIIYKAFSSQTYRDLINLELNRLKNNIMERFEIDINFDESINDILYKEGVFPTLGTRPVFTTINSMIESTMSKITLDIAISSKDVDQINWSFEYDDEAYHIIDFVHKNKVILNKKYDVKLKLENRRKSDGSEIQLLNAVHESGHAVTCILKMGIIPQVIVSKTSEGNNAFTNSKQPSMHLKKWYENDIIVSLSGMIAEKMIFGEDFQSGGSESDLVRATNIALIAAQRYGMLSENSAFGIPNANTQYEEFKDTQATDIEAKTWVNKCYKDAEKCLNDNKTLLIELSKYLSQNSQMKKEQIIEVLDRLNYNVGSKDLDKYYDLHEKFDDFSLKI